MADERFSDRRSGPGLVPWLRGVPLPPRPADYASSAESASAGVTEPASTLPDWLQELQASVVSDAPVSDGPVEDLDASDQPDWLASISADPAPVSDLETTSPQAGQDMPDWLRDLSAGSQPEPEPEPPPAPAPSRQMPRLEGATSWLQNLGAADQAETAPPEQPAPAEHKPPSRQPLRMPVGATDWLRSLGEEPDPNRSQASGQPEATGGTNSPADQANQARAAQQPSAESQGDIPAWLTDINTDELERDLAAQEPTGDLFGSGIEQAGSADFLGPSWLTSQDESQDKPEPGAVPSWLMDADETPAATPDEFQAPSWLSEPDSKPSSADQAAPAWLSPAEEPAETPSADLPDWLRTASEPTSNEPAVGAPGWLQAADDNEQAAPFLPSPEPPEPASAATDLPQQDIPDWLRGADEPPAPTVRRQQDEAGIPAWLQNDLPAAPATDLTNRGEELPPWLVESAQPSDEDSQHIEAGTDRAQSVPDWLQDAAEPRAAEPGQAGGADMPSWLRNAAEPEEPATAQAGVPGAEQLPDWLQDDSLVPGDQASGSSAEQLPGWLQDDFSGPNAPMPSSPPNAPPSAADALPPWLQSDSSGASVASAMPGDAGLPAWLKGADADVPVVPAPAAPRTESTGDLGMDLPPWLREEPSAAPAAKAVPPTQPSSASGSGGDLLGGTDLPGWLRQSDPGTSGAEAGAVAAPPAAQGADWMTRLRTHEDEPEVAPVEAISTIVPAVRPAFTRSPARLEAIALLQRLVADPFPQAAAAPAPLARPVWQRVGIERVLYVLLLVVVLVGLLAPALYMPLQGPTNAPTAASLAERVNTLSDQSVVLVAYEWDSRRRSELETLERTVVGHLAAQKVKLVFISTDIQGTLLAFDARDRLRAESGYQPGGVDYILLGYRPGGELALRSLAQNLPGVLASDFQGEDANQSAVAQDVVTGEPRLKTLNDFAMIVVLADEPQDVQAWMEQVHSNAPSVPMTLLLPNETAPVVRPYLKQPNIAYLVGKGGALAYEQIHGGAQSAEAAAASGQQQFAVLAFIVLSLLGAVIGAVTARTSRGKAS